MSHVNRWATALLRSPVLWGLLASLGFYALVLKGPLETEFFHRYFASHWVLYAETVMFFVAVAQLLLKAGEITDQRARLRKTRFDDVEPLPQAADEARALEEQLALWPAGLREGYFPERVREALAGILRQGTADELDNELKYLAEADAHKSHDSYALVRIIIWAVPILGFLGTVIGLTMAIAQLSPNTPLETVAAALGVAFDTTALALALSMGLMFLQFLVDRGERRLLAEVDARIAAELSPRFARRGSARDPQVAVVRRMAEAVIQASERAVQKQAEVWHATIEAAHDRWDQLTQINAAQLEHSLAGALAAGVETHAQRLAAAERELLEASRKQQAELQQSAAAQVETLRKALETTTERVQQALAGSSAAAQAQQAELREQTATLKRLCEATAQVQSLEDALRRSLQSLAGSQHLEETLLSLAGAVHLLNARLGQLGGSGAAPLVVRHEAPTSKAA